MPRPRSSVLAVGSFLLAAGLVVAWDRGQVELCHCPPGNPENCQTSTVGRRAADAHLSHHADDHQGACIRGGCLGAAGVRPLPPDQLTPWPFAAFPSVTVAYVGQIFVHPAHEPSGLVHVPTVDKLYMVDDGS